MAHAILVSVHTMHDRSIAVYERDGVMYADGIFANVTERKQAEEALLKERDKTLSYLDIAGVIIVILNADQTVALINKKGCELLGAEESEVIGTKWFDNFIPERDRERTRAGFFELVAGNIEPIEYFENYVLAKDNTERLIAWHNTVFRDEKGYIVATLSSGEDITKSRQAKDALRESEGKYRVMMESMKDPVYICSQDYRVEYMNPAMIKRTGRDATGEYCFKALHDLDEKCSWCLHEKKRGKYYELDIVSPKDNRFYHISNSPIAHGDGSVSKMTVFRDTTEMHKMETQLQQAQKMEAIGTLAGGIAHDFNNILFPMLGYTEMMLEDVPDDSPFQDKLQGILTGAMRAGDLVKQILTFSRQSDHEMKPLRIQLVLKEVLKLIRSTLPTTIDISQHIRSDCRLVMADPTQIHQIAMNLMTNAYHAMEGTGGTLTVTLKEVELTAGDLKDTVMVPGPHVCLMVADTGPGMDQGVLDRIFDPYFTTKEEGKGTGLGLAVVHGIVKDHGGHISVFSEPGKGTEFKVYLPVIQTETDAKEIGKRFIVPKGDERILLVDDEQEIVAMLKLMLERLGYHVTCRTSSIEALEAFKQNPNSFDLIITDLTMPNMTGEQLARQIIEIRPDMPVILCTGFSEKMSKKKADALGIKSLVMKPVVKSDLANTIRKALEKDQSDDENDKHPDH